MPFTGDSLTITAEENSSKRLLVLHKSETGLKIGRQTGESTDAVMQRRCGSQRPATPTASLFLALLRNFLRLTPCWRLVSEKTLLFSKMAFLSKNQSFVR